MEIEPPMPVLYFTQLMAIALGLPLSEAALKDNLIDARPLLRERALID
jgi:heterodisulfide reductase subunit B